MSPKKLIIALWAVVALVALAIVFAPSNDGYREFASTPVVAPTVKVAPAAVEVPVVIEKPATVSAVGTSPAGTPAISLGGVSALLADASRVPAPAVAPSAPMSANAQPTAPAPAEVAKDARLAGASVHWRRASTVSKAEIEAAAAAEEEAVELWEQLNHIFKGDWEVQE